MHPAFLLDSSVCIQVLRRRIALGGLPDPARSAISVIVAAELWAGIEQNGASLHRARLEAFLELFPLLDFTPAAARHYGGIRTTLEAKGAPISPLGLLIAAHARSLDATLVTGNIGEFQRVDGLKIFAVPIG